MHFQEAFDKAIKDGVKIRGKDWGCDAVMHWDKEKKCFMRNLVNVPYSGTLNECMSQDWEVVAASKSLVRLIPMGRKFKLEGDTQVLTKIHGHPIYNAINAVGKALKVDDEKYVINVE